jgi:transcriptional regulator with XRE-family HTH domain
VLPFCHVVLRAQKPRSEAYPLELNTLGDHIKKRRLDLKLTQEKVAQTIGVCREVVSDWEAGHTSPRVGLMRKVVEFLGYTPFDDLAHRCSSEETGIAVKLLGLTREKTA